MATVELEPFNSPVLEFREPDGLYEVVDGRIVEKPMGVYETFVAALLYRPLDRYVEAHPLGRIFQEMIFNLRPLFNRERRPDVAFVSFERWARDRRVPQARAWAVIPDLAVEIVSPSNSAFEVQDKLDEYFHSGVRQVWVVYPVHAKVYVYASRTSARILTPADELDGGDVLPGFRLSLGDLFDEAGQPA